MFVFNIRRDIGGLTSRISQIPTLSKRTMGFVFSYLSPSLSVGILTDNAAKLHLLKTIDYIWKETETILGVYKAQTGIKLLKIVSIGSPIKLILILRCKNSLFRIWLLQFLRCNGCRWSLIVYKYKDRFIFLLPRPSSTPPPF